MNFQLEQFDQFIDKFRIQISIGRKMKQRKLLSAF